MPKPTLDLIQLAWLDLGGAKRGGEGYERVQKLPPLEGVSGKPVTVRLTLTEGRRGILLEENCSDEIYRQSTPSIHFGPKTLEGESKSHLFLHIQCLNPALNTPFMFFVAAVIDSLLEGNGVDSAVRSSLERFRELFRRPSGAKLSIEEELGLIGELSFLCDLVEHNPQAIGTWVGPTGERHDFLGEKGFVEVKATRNRDLDEVQISSIDQLALTDDTPLHLAVLVFAEDPAAGQSIASLISRLEAAAVNTTRLYELLSAAGYQTDAQAGAERKFTLIEQRAYRIDGAFPCLTRNSFGPDGPPPGVRNIKYSIDLSHAEEHRLTDEEQNELHATFS